MQIGPFGLPEILAILAIALIVFGPRRLPELSRALGHALREFRKGSEEFKRTLDEEVRDLERTVEAGEIREALNPPEPSKALDSEPKEKTEPIEGDAPKGTES